MRAKCSVKMEMSEATDKVTQNHPFLRIMAPTSDNFNGFSEQQEQVAIEVETTTPYNHKKHRFTLLPSSSASPSPSQPHMAAHIAVESDRGSQPSLPILPHELILEILSRLPVKSLLQFRCVCKSWNSLISDPHFAKSHLRMHSNFTHHKLLLCFARPRFTVRSCSLDSICNALPTSAVTLEYPLKNRNRYDLIVGSCNGLLCFAIKQTHVLLWNPSLRISKKSPCLDNQRRGGSYTVFGFGYDHLTDNYKVVAIFCYDSGDRGEYKTEVKVYTLGANSWRRIQEFPSGIPCDEMGKYASGTLNWMATTASSPPLAIISLDLGNESYVELSKPDCGYATASNLGVLRDCLCIISAYGTHSDLWIMKDFGVKESWTKLLSIPFWIDHPLSLLCTKERCISDGIEILVQQPHQSEIVFYNSKNVTFTDPEIENSDGCLDAEVYVESLISPCL